MMKHLFFCFGKRFAFLYSLFNIFAAMRRVIYSGYISGRFHSFGKNTIIDCGQVLLRGEKYIDIGDNCYIARGCQITATDYYLGEKWTPEIVIGNNCSIGSFCHITAVRGIYIGDNVLTGKSILITDNAHGSFDLEVLDIPPKQRPLSSKGPVKIEDNVWIGDKASIMSGVTIGRGSIVAANSVVTRDIPPYSMVAGSPAKIIKYIG